MAISFSCPWCEQALKVKDELGSGRIKCPKCGGSITVAEPDSGPAALGAKVPKSTRQPAERFDDEARARVGSKGKRARLHDEGGEWDEDERPRRKKKKSGNMGVLIGLSAGGVLLLATIAVVVFVFVRVRARDKQAQGKVNTDAVAV